MVNLVVIYALTIHAQKTIARFYSNIMREIRAELEYFRVGFYGAGFPAFLKVTMATNTVCTCCLKWCTRPSVMCPSPPSPPTPKNKVFIFRGHQYEKLHDFNTRLALQFPNAKVSIASNTFNQPVLRGTLYLQLSPPSLSLSLSPSPTLQLYTQFMTTLEVPGLEILESNEQCNHSIAVANDDTCVYVIYVFLGCPPPDIQACWVDPLPERDTMAKFEGKSVAEPIARLVIGR